jgi:uncharacterized tellurite resistance protein B-like protein
MFFKNNKNEQSEENFSKVAALLIHAAKIDQDYSKEEENIVKKTMLEIGANNENILNIMENAKNIENDTNQILDFTKEVKSMKNEDKIKIVESLWRIIYSDKEADAYETNLMRRLAGLLYIDNKIMGSIKERIKKENC